MTVIINGTAGIQNNATDLSYTGTLTGSTGVVNLGSGQFYKDASGNVGIGTSSPSSFGKFAVVAADGYISASAGATTALTQYIVGDAAYICSAPSSGSNAKSMIFQTGSSGLGTERMRLDSSGNLIVNQTTSAYGGIITSAFTGASQCGLSLLDTYGTYTGNYVIFVNSTGGVAGTISHTSATTVAYNTTSDYRLKENVTPMIGALAKVANLKPCTYTWKADGSDGQGFIAHELQDVVPDCVTGAKDAIDKDGKPQYQGIDTSFLVATLTAAIQELKALIDTQAERIAALEAA